MIASFCYAQNLSLFFQGNTHVQDKNLYEALSLEYPAFYEFWKKKPTIDAKTISLLVKTTKNYYKTKGYFNAKVDYREDNNSITITIDEQEPVIISHLTVISKLDIKSKLPFKVGDVFDAEKFTKSKKDIKLLYTNQSYCNVLVDAKAWVDIQTNLAYINYDITPNNLCHIGTITINPSEHIDSAIIRSLLFFKEKQLFTTQDISDTYSNLYGYEGISKVLINTQIDNNSRVNIGVAISENKKPIRLEGGLGASSDEGLMASLKLKHRNFLTNLKSVSFETRLTSIKQTAKINFDMPLKHQNTAGAELGLENESFSGFKERRLFSTLYFKQRKMPQVFKESLLIDNSLTYDSDDTILFPEGNILITSAKLEWSYDTRDKILDPTKGYFLRSELMGSVQSALSDASYYKLKLEGGYIFPLQNSIFAIKSSFGTLQVFNGDIPASYMFYAGGMNSNRAYTYNQLGPSDDENNPLGFDSIFETTLEYRFPLYGEFGGVLFSDNTFIGDSMFPSSNGYHTLGFGLRYKTPLGPLAVDIGFDVSNPSANYGLHFRIGELF